MQLRSALLAATILATPIVASAQPVTGLYIGGGVGGNFTQKENVSGASAGLAALNGAFLSTNGNISGSSGFAGVVNVGWGFGNGLRAELEGNYRNNESGFANGNFANIGGGQFGVGGGTREQKFGGMVNALYDFNGLTPWFVPYIGAGVGYLGISEQWHTNNNLTLTVPPGGLSATGQTFLPGSIQSSGQSTKGAFAYQAILGAAMPLQIGTPGLAVTFEYRFLGTTGHRDYGGLARATSTTGATFATGTAFQVGSSYNHSILVGLRYNFGVAPPPPPPPAAVPVQAPARSYLVFFDWDKATLTDRARQIIAEAAANSSKVQYTRIEVNGYTDTSGTPKYNQGLSVRRARAVQAELIKDGVPQGAITIQGFGDTHLLVPTGPGVREPQNRRVEIIIR
jgi:outer membrane protein OmpA-like peptidoglycan-associated protein